MEVDIAHSETDSTAGSGEVIKTEEEEILVYVNVDDANDDFIAEDLESFKVIGLDTDEPIIQVGDKFFGGSWNEVVGTAVFFKETTPQPKRCYFSDKVPKPLKYIGKTQKSLNLKRAFITDLKADSSKKCNSNAHDDSSNVEVKDCTQSEMETETREILPQNSNLNNTATNNSSDITNENSIKGEQILEEDDTEKDL